MAKNTEADFVRTPEDTVKRLRLFADYRPFWQIRSSLNRAADLLEQHCVAKDSLNDDAYLLSAECPSCGNHIQRGYEECVEFCRKCGQKIHFRAFTEDELERARQSKIMDEYEDL